MSLKSKLRLSASSFDIFRVNTETDKLFDQTARKNYNNFINHPQSKNFEDFQHFIEFISPKDFMKLHNTQRRDLLMAQGGLLPETSPALIQAFHIKQDSMNKIEGQASSDNFMSLITGSSFSTLEKIGKCLSGLYADKILQGSNGRYLIYMIDSSKNLSEVQEKYKDHQFEIDDQVAFCYIEFSPFIGAIGNVYQKLNNGLVISIDGDQLNDDIHSRFCSNQPFALVKQDYLAAFEINNKTLEKFQNMAEYLESHNSLGFPRQPMGAQGGYNPLLLLPQSQHQFGAPNLGRPVFQNGLNLNQQVPFYEYPVCAKLVEDLLRENLEDKENEALLLNIGNNITFLDKGLNPEQKNAVIASLAVSNLYLIDGPAGTGKTRVLAEIIHQCVKRGLKVLACGPSVFAVDNLIGRILDKNIKGCRIGKSGNPDENIDKFSLDTLLKTNKRIKLIEDECDALLQYFKITEDKLFLSKMEENAGIARQYQSQVGKVIVDYADVVFSTLKGAAATVLDDNNFVFDVVIIDECSQATELAAWAPILRSKKLIIAGDRLQLPPFIISEKAKRTGLNFTLFDRLRKRLPSNLRQVLRVQYRMNEKIMAWSNEHFYKGKLIANDICAQYTLQEYLKEDSEVKENEVPILMLIDTKNSGFGEKRTKSYSNIGEAAVVLGLLESLLMNYNLKKEEIGVISPYEDQHELITKAIECKEDLRGIKCQTVDYFQGKEKEVIIISLVRSNKDKIVGFLDDSRRMNVAVTRAKRFVAIICDTNTLCKPEMPFMMKLIDQFKKNGQALIPKDFKGIDYQIKFLNSVLKGDIKPPEELKKEQAKSASIASVDVINQVLKDKPFLKFKPMEEEEEKVNPNEGRNEKKPLKLKFKVSAVFSALKDQNVIKISQPPPSQNSDQPFRSQPQQSVNMMHQPFPNLSLVNESFQNVPVAGHQGNGFIQNNLDPNPGIDINHDSSQNVWGNGDLPRGKKEKEKKPQSSGRALKDKKNQEEVEKSVFVKKDSKKSKNIKHAAFKERRHGAENSEDFPELEKGWILKEK